MLMVSGSDAHGTPITVKADQEGTTPQEVVDRYHPEILGYWDSLGISFDLFTTTMTENHREVTWDMFRRCATTDTSPRRRASSSTTPKPSGSSPTATSRGPALIAVTTRLGATNATTAVGPSTPTS